MSTHITVTVNLVLKVSLWEWEWVGISGSAVSISGGLSGRMWHPPPSPSPNIITDHMPSRPKELSVPCREESSEDELTGELIGTSGGVSQPHGSDVAMETSVWVYVPNLKNH